MLSNFPLEAEIQMFSVEEAAGVVYKLHHLKGSLYLCTFVFTSMKTHSVATETALLGNEQVYIYITSNKICIVKYYGLQHEHLSHTMHTPLSVLHQI